MRHANSNYSSKVHHFPYKHIRNNASVFFTEIPKVELGISSEMFV